MNFFDELDKVETNEKTNWFSEFLYYIFALLITAGFAFVMVTILL